MFLTGLLSTLAGEDCSGSGGGTRFFFREDAVDMIWEMVMDVKRKMREFQN